MKNIFLLTLLVVLIFTSWSVNVNSAPITDLDYYGEPSDYPGQIFPNSENTSMPKETLPASDSSFNYDDKNLSNENLQAFPDFQNSFNQNPFAGKLPNLEETTKRVDNWLRKTLNY